MRWLAERHHPLLIAARWIAAAVLLRISLRCLAASQQGDMMGGLGYGLVGVGLLAGAVIIASPDLIRIASNLISRFIIGLFFPQEHATLPLDYTLARFYRKKERWEEALAQYEKLLDAHPKALPAYIEAIEVASAAGWPEEARKLLTKALRRLPPEDHAELRTGYAAVSRTNPPV